MTNVIFDSLRVLSQNTAAVLSISLIVCWGMIISMALLKITLKRELGFAEYFSIAAGGWVLPVFMISILVFVMGIIFNVRPNPKTASAVLALSAVPAIWFCLPVIKKQRPGIHAAFWLLCIILLLSAFLRLAFVAATPLPLYADSAQHYWIIQNFIRDFSETKGLQNFVLPVPVYYHVGFHLITAILTAVFRLEIAKTILVFGQAITALAPIPLFFLIKRETGSDAAGVLAVILGYFGWYMPVFAVNWGKYPALLSLLTTQFSLSIAYLIAKEQKLHQSWTSIGILLLSIGMSFFVHTRSIILIGFAFAVWTLAHWWEYQTRKWRFLFLGILAGGLVTEAVLISRNPNLNPLFDPYLGSAIWVTAFVALFSIFAFRKYPWMAFACLTFIFFILFGLFIPIPHPTDLTLLDRPLVEMILFTPLSLLGGLGYAGLGDIVPSRLKSVTLAGTVLFVGGLLFHSFTSYSFYPSKCCMLVTQDDSVALDWLDKHVPQTTTIAISSTELRITASSQNPQVAGSDAGVWITPLTNRPTFLLPYSTDFSRVDTLNFLCEQGISDIYIGNKTQSFNRGLVEEEPNWYKNILFLPETQIFQVIGCN